MATEVRATQPGFYKKLRNVGDVFTIKNMKAFSEKWMEKVEEPEPQKEEPKVPDQKTETDKDSNGSSVEKGE